MSRSFILATGVLFTCTSGTLVTFAEDSKPRSDPHVKNQSLQAGVSLKTAKAILTAAKIPQGGLRAFAAHPEGDRWLFHALRKGKVDLVIQYSPHTEQVTGLTLYFIGYPRSKRSDVAVSATAIQFHPEGSYTVVFPPAFAEPNTANPGTDKSGQTNP